MNSFYSIPNGEWLDAFLERTKAGRVSRDDIHDMRYFRAGIIHEGDADDQRLLPHVDRWRRQHDR